MELSLTVLIADDQHLVRAGLRTLIESTSGFEVVAEASSGEDAAALAHELRPDVVLMDVRMPGCGGIEATRQIRERDPGVRIVMVTSYDHDEVIVSALRAGASGFVPKSDDPGLLVDAIRAVADGGMFLPPRLLRRLVETWLRGPIPGDAVTTSLTDLSERELDVLRCVGMGCNNQEIAEALGIGEPTVKTHVSNLLRKLGARDRVQAVIVAFESGLVRPGDRP